MATVSNLTGRTLNVGGKQLAPGEIGVNIDRSESELKNHLFARSGWITVEGKVHAVSAPKKDDKPSLKDLKAEAAETQDMDRLIELSEDSRKSVSEIAQQRLDEMGGE